MQYHLTDAEVVALRIQWEAEQALDDDCSVFDAEALLEDVAQIIENNDTTIVCHEFQEHIDRFIGQYV